MPADSPNSSASGDMPTTVVRDGQGRQLLCYLEELVPIDGVDYALLSPVDTPVILVHLPQDGESVPQEIDDWQTQEPILEVAEAVLQEHNLTLVRSAITLTVTGDFEESDDDEEDEIEEGEALADGEELDEDDELATYESLLDRPFYVGEEQYDLFSPLEPFIVVAVLQGQDARLVEGEEFKRVKPLIEAELEQREWGD